MGIDRPTRRSRTARVLDRAVQAVATAPVTTAYALVLLVTTVVLRHLSSADGERVLRFSSTDVAHLVHDPLVVLVLSALWLPGRLWLPYGLALLLVGAPLERRIGSGLVVLVFLSGHVLATLLTELPIGAAVLVGWLGTASAHRTDVGASYGTLAVVAAYVGSLSRVRGLVLVVLAFVLLAGLPTDDMTTYGHALSLAIGVCWWPRLYDRVPWRRPRDRRPRDRRHPGASG